MMGRKQDLRSGDEVDAVSRRARKVLKFRAGERSRIKRALNKRFRKDWRREAA